MKQVIGLKYTIFSLLVVILFAFVFRVYNINELPVFADEAIYIRWAQVMRVVPEQRFLPLSDGKQPLFMWLVIPFLKLISDPLIAGRIVSALAGIGTTLGVFALSYLLFNSKRSALIAGLLFAVSPFAVFFDRMALADSLLAFFGIWYLMFVIITAKNLRLDTAMIAGFFLGGAFLTKSPAIFFVLLTPVSLLFSRRVLKLLPLWLVSWGIGYGFYNILRLGPEFHKIAERNLDYVYPVSHLLEKPLDPFLPYLDRALEWIKILGPFEVLLLAILATVLSFKKFWRAIVALLMFGLVPIMVQAEFAKVFTARYIFFSFPPLVVLASAVFLKEQKKFKYLVNAILVLFVLHSLWFNNLLFHDLEAAPLPNSERSGYLEEWTAGTGIKESAEYIKRFRDANPSANIIVGTEGYFGTLPNGMQIYLEREPRITVIGIGLSISEVPDDLKNAKRAGDTVFLVVNSSRLAMNKPFEEYGVKVIKEFKKADRKVFSHEQAAHGLYDTFYLFEVTEKALEL